MSATEPRSADTSSDATTVALAGIRVLEVGTGTALAYAGKLFADLGAAVLKVEPPGGDPMRREPPLLDGAGARFAWLNANKRAATADWDAAEGVDRLRSLLRGRAVLLDARPRASRVAAPLGDDDPALVRVAISAFGDHGPYRDFRATDATIRALAGVFTHTGPVDGPPSMLGGHSAGIAGGIAAFNGAAAALLGGVGRQLEASEHEACLLLAEYQVAQCGPFPETMRRYGVNRFAPTCPMGVYRCREGWLGVTVVTPAQWRACCEMLDMPDEAADPRHVIGIERLARADAIEPVLRERLMRRTALEWFDEALRRRLPFAVVPDMAELLRDGALRARGALAAVRVGAATAEGPAVPLHLTLTPPLRDGAAPALGEHDAEEAVAGAPSEGVPAAATPAGSGSGSATVLPLAGVRIVDLSMGWAGPLATRQMGDLGAEVIKVEACNYPDWWRGVDPRPEFFADRRYEHDARFAMQNRNKRGITLDLASAEGVALFKRLVREADAVVENYARDVLPKLGLDYPVLRRERPDLVMVSMAAFGAGHPWQDLRAYGSTLEHASGLPSVSGEADWPPTTNHLALGDPVGGMNATAALLAALLHRRRTGQGQHVDLSLVECLLPLAAPWMLRQSVTGSPGPRLGNRDPVLVPHGAFPCAPSESEPDGWIVLGIGDDAEWRALCDAIGRPDWRDDPALGSPLGRRAREDELDAGIAAWSRGRNADAAMHALQAAGVAAGVCRSPAALLADPHLAARHHWQTGERPFLGRHTVPSSPFRDAGAGPYPVRLAAPTLGQHNDAVLGDLLGLSEAERAGLAARGIIGTEAVPVAQRKPRAAA